MVAVGTVCGGLAFACVGRPNMALLTTLVGACLEVSLYLCSLVVQRGRSDDGEASPTPVGEGRVGGERCEN